MAVVYEYNDIYKTNDWNVYLINNKSVDLEMVVIVSQGFSETKTTLKKKFIKLFGVVSANFINFLLLNFRIKIDIAIGINKKKLKYDNFLIINFFFKSFVRPLTSYLL